MSEVQDRKTKDNAPDIGAIFAFFNEIGIINQLTSTILQKHLPDGVTVAQFSVLNHLTRVKDGQTPQRLASAFQVPKTSMTHSLAGLQKRAFIEFRPNARDGRSKCVWLTDAGRSFRTEAINTISQDMVRLAPKIDFESLVQMTPALADLREVLDADRD
jgi:DNA-binding MarR family transcriptional regulator